MSNVLLKGTVSITVERDVMCCGKTLVKTSAPFRMSEASRLVVSAG